MARRPDPDDLLEPPEHSGDPEAPRDLPHFLDPDYREAHQTRAGRWHRGRWEPPPRGDEEE